MSDSANEPQPPRRRARRQRRRPTASTVSPTALPPSARRQILVLVLLLAIVAVLSYRLVLELKSVPEVPEASPNSTSGLLGKTLPPELLEGPPEPEPPQPFEENPVMLGFASALDKTSDLSEEATTYLLQKILTQGESFRNESPVLDMQKDDRLFWELYEQPDRYRGKLVEIVGSLVTAAGDAVPLQLRGLDTPNPSGRDRVFQSYVFGADGKYYAVVTLNQRDDLQHREAVRLRGYFCQLYTNYVQHGGQQRRGTIPFLIGEDYTILEVPEEEPSNAAYYLPIIILLPLAALLCYAFWQRRARQSYRRRLDAARSAQRGSREPEGANPSERADSLESSSDSPKTPDASSTTRSDGDGPQESTEGS